MLTMTSTGEEEATVPGTIWIAYAVFVAVVLAVDALVAFVGRRRGASRGRVAGCLGLGLVAALLQVAGGWLVITLSEGSPVGSTDYVTATWLNWLVPPAAVVLAVLLWLRAKTRAFGWAVFLGTSTGWLLFVGFIAVALVLAGD